MDDARRQDIAARLRWQAMAEPFNGVLLRAVADEIANGGAAWRPLAPVAHLPETANLPLRLLGAAHRLALDGAAPAYAAHLPSCRGDGDAHAAGRALVELCETGALDEGVHQAVQTNEPGRTTTLLPGLAVVARSTGLPLRLLEIGASAGLLLHLDRYHHTIGGEVWGDPGSPVRFRCGGSAPLAPFRILDRRGCDAEPRDPVADRTLLLSFVWPSQVERFRTTDAALAIASAHPVRVDRATASDWLAEQLGTCTPGAATVVVESILWQYLPEVEQRAVTDVLRAAGSRASTDAPLAWLALEPGAPPELGAELRLRSWPGGAEQLLARCGYHGAPIDWLDRGSPAG